MTKQLLLLLQLVVLLSLGGCCDWFKKNTTAAKSESAQAEAESALMPNITSEEHFAKLLSETNKVLVLKIDAPWCSACKFLHPLLIEAAKQAPELVFARLNIDQLANIAQQHNVVGIPTLLFFKDGKEIQNSRIEGAEVKDSNELLEKIRTSAKRADIPGETIPASETAAPQG